MKTTIHSPKSGFSLIELLVVLSIIVTVILLCIPSARLAMERALAAKCIANQRQLFSAIMLYAGEHDGYVPPLCTGNNVGNSQWWTNLLVDGKYASDGAWNDRNWGSIITGVFSCPSVKNKKWYGGIAISEGVASWNGKSVRLSSVENPAIVSLLADAPWNGKGSAMPNIYNTYGSPWLGSWHVDRHNKGGNVTFLDGHCEFWLDEDLIKNKNGVFTKYWH